MMRRRGQGRRWWKRSRRSSPMDNTPVAKIFLYVPKNKYVEIIVRGRPLVRGIHYTASPEMRGPGSEGGPGGGPCE